MRPHEMDEIILNLFWIAIYINNIEGEFFVLNNSTSDHCFVRADPPDPADKADRADQAAMLSHSFPAI